MFQNSISNTSSIDPYILYLNIHNYLHSKIFPFIALPSSAQHNLFCQTCSTSSGDSIWKTTSNLFSIGRQTQFFLIEDNLNILSNGWRPQYFVKWKTTSIFWKIEEGINILSNRIFHKCFEKWRWTQFIFNWKATSILFAGKTTSILFARKTTSISL